MSPKEQQIAIEKACGWQSHTPCCAVMDVTECDEYREPPDYLNNLNAMHTAVKGLLFSQRRKYRNALIMVCSRGLKPDLLLATEECIDATAAQRAEAFLRALDLWTTEQAIAK